MGEGRSRSIQSPKKNFLNDIHGSFASVRYLFQFLRTNNLWNLLLSWVSITFTRSQNIDGLIFTLFVLTGTLAPVADCAIASLVDVIARIPELFDLRLSFAKTSRYQTFENLSLALLPPLRRQIYCTYQMITICSTKSQTKFSPDHPI